MEQFGRKPHDEMQQAYFNERVEFFTQPIPESIQKRTRQIVAQAGLTADSCVLDVGTGIGVLIGHFLDAGVQPENIVGCDLSVGMLEQARSRYPSVCFWIGDCLDFSLDKVENLPGQIKDFSAVFFNACFGNIWDQVEALKVAAAVLNRHGKIVISHPLGARFVAALHKGEPEIVPHLLPNREELEGFCQSLHMVPGQFVDEPELYIAVLEKVAHS